MGKKVSYYDSGGRKSEHPPRVCQTWERKSATYCAPQCETIDYDRRSNSNAFTFPTITFYAAMNNNSIHYVNNVRILFERKPIRR